MTRYSKFDSFVRNIDLEEYRKKYVHIKIVEMDLPREIQALKCMYKYYWEEIDINNILDFESFFEKYLSENKDNIEKFRVKVEMCPICFYKGLRARIYRTWASIITQIHAGYVAETVFGEKSINMNDELDHKGKDFTISYNGKVYGIQVKKETHRPEARINRKNDNENIFIHYCVPSHSDFEKPYYKKTGKIKPQMLDFIQFSKDGILNRYGNGFVVFTKKIFEDLKQSF